MYLKRWNGTQWEEVYSSELKTVIKNISNNNDTLSSGDNVLANTTGGAFTLYLPPNPTVGDHIKIHDSNNSFASYNLTINSNGLPISGTVDNLVCDISGVIISLYYEGSSVGWRLVNDSNSGVIAGYVGATDWVNYTPVLTAATTNPTIGNGTILGRWKYLDNKTVALYIGITFGSTSTYGSGAWYVSLPSGLVSANTHMQLLIGCIMDNGTDWKLAVGRVNPASTTICPVPEGGSDVNNTSPMTWANGDTLMLQGVIEIA